MADRDLIDRRTLVHAPVGRDAALTEEVLKRADLPCQICGGISELCEEFERGAGAIILTEEVLDRPGLRLLTRALDLQPAWSDVPVLLFAGGEQSRASLRTLQTLELLRNVTLLDRPVRLTALVSTLRAALRARERQYELRDVLMALRAARDEAERANRLKDDFLATLSHELRTPLNAILGWVSMLQNGQAPPDRLAHALGVIRRNADLQAQIVADVLDMSRIITGRMQLAVEPLDLGGIIASAVETIRPAADAKELTIGVDVAEGIPTIHGDGARLQQILWNLLSNAVKFTPVGGRIAVSARRGGMGVLLSVADTGAGLDVDFLPYAFDRFRQGDQSFTRTQGGLGLGLAIVKHLVELHGGQVTAYSEGPNTGATFVVELPVVSKSVGTEAEAPSSPMSGDLTGPSHAPGNLAGPSPAPGSRQQEL
jgi:signal transduction histidine kinase